MLWKTKVWLELPLLNYTAQIWEKTTASGKLKLELLVLLGSAAVVLGLGFPLLLLQGREQECWSNRKATNPRTFKADENMRPLCTLASYPRAFVKPWPLHVCIQMISFMGTEMPRVPPQTTWALTFCLAACSATMSLKSSFSTWACCSRTCSSYFCVMAIGSSSSSSGAKATSTPWDSCPPPALRPARA